MQLTFDLKSQSFMQLTFYLWFNVSCSWRMISTSLRVVLHLEVSIRLFPYLAAVSAVVSLFTTSPEVLYSHLAMTKELATSRLTAASQVVFPASNFHHLRSLLPTPRSTTNVWEICPLYCFKSIQLGDIHLAWPASDIVTHSRFVHETRTDISQLPPVTNRSFFEPPCFWKTRFVSSSSSWMPRKPVRLRIARKASKES